MSGILEQAQDLEAWGLCAGPETTVCSEHIANEDITDFIKKNGTYGSCEYCSREGKTVGLEDLMKFIMEPVHYFYSDPVNFSLFLSSEGGYQIPCLETIEILKNEFYLDVLDTKLDEDMESWIDPFRIWANEKHFREEGQCLRPKSWGYFCFMVKHKARYFYPKVNPDELERILGPIELLNEIKGTIKKMNLIVTLGPEDLIFRIRQHYKGDSISGPEDISAPPIALCKFSNRMSPAGISMFYGALDVNTAYNEVIDYEDEKKTYTVAKFSPNVPIKVIDLSNLPELPSVFNHEKREVFEDIFFLRDFREDVSKKIEKDGREHIEYIPTQVVTEFFKYSEDLEVDGMIYPSSRNSGGRALVLFYNQEDCLKNLNLQRSLVTKEVKC